MMTGWMKADWSNHPSLSKGGYSLQAPVFQTAPAPSTSFLHLPANAPQFRYSAPIESTVESTVDATAVITWILSEQVFLLVKETSGPLYRSEKILQGGYNHQMSPGSTNGAAHMVSTISVGAVQAAPALPLRTLDMILNGTTSVTGIVDSDCQVVIICWDVWEGWGPLSSRMR